MRRMYSNELKQKLCQKVCVQKESTSRIAKENDIPIKTLEKWITAYNKNPDVFDCPTGYAFEKRRHWARRYDDFSKEELIAELKRRDTRIEYLQSVLQAQK